jgi:hypothetical protein
MHGLRGLKDHSLILNRAVSEYDSEAIVLSPLRQTVPLFEKNRVVGWA